MKPVFTFMVILAFCACKVQKPVSSVKPDNNNDYTVKYLFEYGGCKVYRFIDQGKTVYFTNCNGEAISMTDSTEIRNTIKVSKER